MEPIMSKPKYVSRDINDLKDMLEQTVALHSEDDAFIKKTKDTYIGVSYKKYKEDVFGLGTELLKRNIKGEKLILLSENRYEWCVTFLAAACNGAAVVPISDEISENELVSRINHVRGKFIVFSEKYRDLIKSIRKKCPTLEYTIDMDAIIDDSENLSLLRLIELGIKAISNGENDFAKLEINNESVAGIFYGNTIVKGKGVMLSHKNLVSAIMGIVSFLPIITDDKTSVFLHLSNLSACLCDFLVMINQGGTVCFAEKNKPLFETLKDTNPTVIFLSKELLVKMHDNVLKELGGMPNVRKVKLLMIIATVLIKFNFDLRKMLFKEILKNFGKNLNSVVLIDKEVKGKLLKDFYIFGFETIRCYEVLEASSVATVNNKREFVKDNVIGEPLPGVKAQIVSRGNKSFGELVLSGDTVMAGYYDDRKATKKVMGDYGLYTGKTGYRDKKGCFYEITKTKE